MERVGRDEGEASPFWQFLGKIWEVKATAIASLGETQEENPLKRASF